VPMQYSVPIFCGGMVRWGVDAWALRKSAAAAAGGSAEERAAAEVAAIAKTESSPAVLLASGFIAGGSLAGVLLAFLNLPLLEKLLAVIDCQKRIKDTFLGKSEVAIPLAIVVFGGLIGMLLLTGVGKLFRQPDEEAPPRDLSARREE